jgi:hypothetical protein
MSLGSKPLEIREPCQNCFAPDAAGRDTWAVAALKLSFLSLRFNRLNFVLNLSTWYVRLTQWARHVAASPLVLVAYSKYRPLQPGIQVSCRDAPNHSAVSQHRPKLCFNDTQRRRRVAKLAHHEGERSEAGMVGKQKI